MYQVIEMYGDSEPWWFFDDWKKDVQSEKNFDSFDEAKQFFDQALTTLTSSYEHEKQKGCYLIAFWNEGEDRYCEECEEDLQQYKGLLLLKDGEKLATESEEINEATDYSGKTQCCQRFGKGFRSKSSK